MPTLLLVADYGSDSLATAEVLLAIQQHARVHFAHFTVASHTFNTIHTGFLASQLSHDLSPREASQTVLFLNTDPRTHNKNTLANAEGEPLFLAELRNGAVVISPNAGHSLSFLKREIIKLFEAVVPAEGSQFRSRDFFPQVIGAALGREHQKWIRSPIALERIPDPPSHPIVLHTDNYGNIKTSLTVSQLDQLGVKIGDLVSIQVPNQPVLRAKFAASIFDVEPGGVVLALGSSGQNGDCYLEIAVRFNGPGTTMAATRVGHPESGTPFDVEP